eukprot:TRINITY_DN6045_c0_g1_i1.p1 TRINITY_DN6045_c0_g1~~TRINITY_DN6045_c0_g1_i1.p1  ORF type:complete len:1048 (+),score=244.35 TRINITY_DN6045_c0_g1_i1:170-3313(+)
MKADRVLRSSKRQRVGLAGIGSAALMSSTSERASDGKRHSSNSFLENRQISSENIQNSKTGESNIAYNNDTVMGCNEGSSDLFPDQNDKLASTLLSLKGVDSHHKHKVFSRTSKKWHSDISGEVDCNPDMGKHIEKISNLCEPHREVKELQKLKAYIEAKGGCVGDGWKVHITKGNKAYYKSFHSPDGKRFRSMKEVARHLGFLSENTEEISNIEAKHGGAVNSPVLINPIEPQLQLNQSSTVDSSSKVNENAVMGTDDSHNVLAPSVLVPVLENSERPVQNGPDALNRTARGEIKEKVTLDKMKVPLSNGKEGRSKNRAWVVLLEEITKASNVPAYVIKNKIKMALEMDPPEWVKQTLISLVATHAQNNDLLRSIKDDIRMILEKCCESNLEEPGYKDTVIEIPHENLVSLQESEMVTAKSNVKESAKKDDCFKNYLPLEGMNEACKSVWQDITSSEKFAALCSLIHGVFGGLRPREVIDFQLIELRMKAGTYGASPRLFRSDIEEIWKKVHSIGQEMIDLADELSKLFCSSYNKQLAGWLAVEANINCNAGETNMDMIGSPIDPNINQEKCHEVKNLHNHKRDDIESIETLRAKDGSHNINDASTSKILQSREKKTGKVLSGVLPGKKTQSQEVQSCVNTEASFVRDDNESTQVLCKCCGRIEDSNSFLFCGACKASYHRSCISSTYEDMPYIWYCSSCLEKKASYELYPSSCNRVENMAEKIANVPTSSDFLAEDVSHQKLVLSPHETREYQNSRGNGTKEEYTGTDVDSALVEAQRDEDQLDLNRIQAESHHCNQVSGVKEENLSESKCKICGTTRGDDFLIKCSNEHCHYKYYHLRCLRPPLASIPSPIWFCPSCLCRICFIDKDDDDTILCDGCDEAYHTYCLKPPLKSIPDSDWYCPSCLKKRMKKKGKRQTNHSASYSVQKVRSKQIQKQNKPSFNRTVTDLDQSKVPGEFKVQSKRSFATKVVESDEVGTLSLTLSGNEQARDEDDVKALSDGSHEHTSDKFIVRVRPKQMAKYAAEMKLKEGGKRKRKCSEPRRSEV